MNTTGATRGYTLLELLAYFSVFAVAVNLAGALFVSSTRLHMLGDGAIARMQAVDEITDAFTDAVNESLGVVGAADGYTTNADTLVLRLPGERYAVLGRLRGDDRFVITEFRSGEPGAPTFLETCSYPVESLAFDQLSGAVRMRLHMQRASRAERNARGEHIVIAAPRSYAEAP